MVNGDPAANANVTPPMRERTPDPVISRVLTEESQGPETRRRLFEKLEVALGRPVVSFFTSFVYPVRMENADADMLESVLRQADLSKGFALMVSSPGGDGLAAERIINICRCYSGTGEYWAIVPGKAKSAATMVCFGASKVMMGPVSELGPIDPQLTTSDKGAVKWFSVYNLVQSYRGLFNRAVAETGRIEPYLQQLANYDEREIKEFEAALELAEDIAIRALGTGMMKEQQSADIRTRIKKFLTPEETKTHGRPICHDDAAMCGLCVEKVDVRSQLWDAVYELYVRTNNFVSKRACKCIESKEHSFFAPAVGRGDRP